MTADVGTIVLFGASGDLARTHLFPALYRLEEQRELRQRIVGVALDDWSDDDFASHVAGSVTDAVSDTDPAVLRRLEERLGYVSGDYADENTFARLAGAVAPGGACLHYLAIPPSMFEPVAFGLEQASLIDQSKLLVEKPFGRDLESARDLNAVLHRIVDEESIYRIDHFLGKEPVENLLTFRYANPIIDAVWNRHYIDHIQITMAESFGVADRGALYETLGVVRDVVQNHLLQVIAMLAMEAPVTPEADSHADERFKVLRAMRTIEPADVVYGQYTGYRAVDHVDPDSRTPTYVAFRAAIDTPRWFGVPIYVRAGKGLAVTATEAVVQFCPAAPLSFSPDRAAPAANRLVFTIGPEDAAGLVLQTKQPGPGVRLATTALTVDYERAFGRIPLAYERLLHDALAGDHSQFGREDAVEEAWRIVAPILDSPQRPAGYQIGTMGPPSTGVLDDGHSWIDPPASRSRPGTDRT